MFSFGILACSSGKKDTAEDSAEFDQAAEDIQGQIERVLVELPPPTEVPYLLEATGAEFDQSLVNDIQNIDKYKSTNDKAALNLGIYASDIGYLSSYNQVQEALNYMNSAKGLGDELGLNNVFTLGAVERFENNLGNKDSLGVIVNEVISNSDKHLQDSERKKVGALLLAGSFVEGLYLSTAIVENYPQDLLPEDSRNLILVPIIRVILNQEEPLADLITLLKSVEQESEVPTMVTELEELKTLFEALKIGDKIQNNRGDLLVNDSNLVEITNKVGSIRDYITS